MKQKKLNSQHNKFRSRIKNGTEVTLEISPNVVGDFNDENDFLHKMLLTNTQISNLRKDFANSSTANINIFVLGLLISS